MGWLVDRLTPYKQREPRWVDLARALEHYWDTYNTPALDRIEQMRSVFHAHGEDIERLLAEAGVQFEVAVPIVESNRAFAYAWRSYEIHRKDNADVLGQVLSRDFSGLDVRWLPLLARKSLPYGVGEMLSEYEIDMVGARRADYHRTYRGVVLANLSGIRSVGHTTESFSEIVNRKIDVLRPAHVVHEGFQFFQVFRAEIDPEIEHFRHLCRDIVLPFGLWGQWVYDHLPADESLVDAGPLEHIRELRGRGARIFGWGGLGEAFQRTTGTLGQHSEQQTQAQMPPAIAVPAAFDGDRFHMALLGLRGHHLSLDGSQADGDLLDPNPLESLRQRRSTLPTLEAWAAPHWALDAGQVIDGAYWAWHGLEGDRQRYSVLGHHQERQARFLPRMHPQSQSSAMRRGAPGYWTLGRNPFDVMWGDSEPLDEWAGAEFPGITRRDLGQAGAATQAWAMPLWGLDVGQVIDGDWWGHHGVEGAPHPRFLSQQHASRTGTVRPVMRDGTTRRGRFSLPLNTNRYSGETMQVAAQMQGAGQHASRQGGTRTERGPLPDFAAFDSLPADLAPLDMHYEDA